MPTFPLFPSTFLFDWGDTVMHDDPARCDPMVHWPQVRAVEGIAAALAALQARGRHIHLATSASISNEAQIRAALARVALDGYFGRIFCFQNTGLPKGPAFYRHILQELCLPATEVVMVGDSFEKDVLAANEAGLCAVWFNPHSQEAHNGDMHTSLHHLADLPTLFPHTRPSQLANR